MTTYPLTVPSKRTRRFALAGMLLAAGTAAVVIPLTTGGSAKKAPAARGPAGIQAFHPSEATRGIVSDDRPYYRGRSSLGLQAVHPYGAAQGVVPDDRPFSRSR